MSGTSDKEVAKYQRLQEQQAQGRKKLGQILVEQGIITPLSVERVLLLSKSSGRRFGVILEELGLVTGEELAQALALQYGYKVIGSFAQYAYPENILQAIPVEAALEHTIFPMKIQNGMLAVAMHDPTNERIVEILTQDTRMKVCPFVATRKEILAAIARHYLKQEPVEQNEQPILLVDDDLFFQKTTTAMLRDCGHKIIIAGNGMEAFNKAVVAKPILIITDKEMPKFNGYALLNSLKGIPETKSIPVILVSSSSNPDEEAEAYEKGFFDYLQKPLRERLLKAKVSKALRSRAAFFLAR